VHVGGKTTTTSNRRQQQQQQQQQQQHPIDNNLNFLVVKNHAELDMVPDVYIRALWAI
jgi:hypothetical protein